MAAIAAASLITLALSAGPALAHSNSQGSYPGSSYPGNGHHPGGPSSPIKEVAAGLVSPLKVAFGPRGSYLVAESFAGQLTSISAKGEKSVVVSAPGQEIAGVSYSYGTSYYLNNDQGEQAPGEEPGAVNLPTRLMRIDARGNTTTMADLSVHEAANNPDGNTVYGVRAASAECLQQAPYMQAKGEVFSHPYSTSPTWGGVFVGDAGANNIMFVSDSGKVRLVRQLPAEPVTIDETTVGIFAQMGMAVPACMMGMTYYAQAVPTDVEVNGMWIYYTVLPGVPAELLGVGKVYRTNIFTGYTQTMATGLKAPTGVAVNYDGTMYVAELMGDGVSVIKAGKAVNVIPAAMSSDVALSNDGRTLAALTNALAETGGSLVTRGVR